MMQESSIAQSVLAVLVVAAALSESGVDGYRQCVKVAYPLMCNGQSYDGAALLMMIERDSFGFIDSDDFMGIQVYNASTMGVRPVHRRRRQLTDNSLKNGFALTGGDIQLVNDTTNTSDATNGTTTTVSVVLKNATTTFPNATTISTTPTELGANNVGPSSEAFCEDELGTIEPVLYVRHFCGVNNSKETKEEFCVRLDVLDTDIYADGDINHNLLVLDLSDKNSWIDFESCKQEFDYYAPSN